MDRLPADEGYRTYSEAHDRLTVVYAFLDFNDGGAQRLTLGTWRHLDPERYRPLLLCVRREGSLVSAAVAAGVPVHVLGRLERPFDLRALSAISRWLRSVGADIVHVPLYSRASPYVRIAAQLAGVELVVAHEHCRASPPARRRWLVDRLLVGGTRFVAVSEAQRTELVCQGVSPDLVAVIGNGVDTERFAPGDRVAARTGLGLPADRPIVLVPARLVRRKGHIDLLAAMPALLAQVPDVLVLCAGGGPLAPLLPALACAAGMADHVTFLGHRDDLPDLLAAADVVCLPSRAEGMPLAILEAMAAGRAVVATDVGGVAEAVLAGETGRIVPLRDPTALATALADMLRDDARRAAMAQRARAVAIERFRERDMTRRLESAYEHWLAVFRLPSVGAIDRSLRRGRRGSEPEG